jgi:hypothetical protein
MRSPFRLFVILLILPVFASCSSGKYLDTSEREVTRFRELMSSEQFSRIYSQGAEELKQAATEEDLVKLLTAVNAKLGPVKKADRNGWNVNFHTSGTYVTLGYRTDFEKGDGTEQFVYRIAKGKAILVGYHINSNALITN